MTSLQTFSVIIILSYFGSKAGDALGGGRREKANTH